MTNNRTRKQASRAVAAARGTRRGNTPMAVGIVVVVVLALAVGGGVWYQKHRAAQAAESVIPVQQIADPSIPAVFDPGTGTVLVGKDTAKVTVDAYEDFLCPICGDFERANFGDLEQRLSGGAIKIRYHMLNLLADRSNPPGYSTIAANTALAVATADPKEFLAFHKSLFWKQPEENGTGWTQDQLSNLAQRLGVTGDKFTSLVNGSTYAAKIQQNLQTAENDQSLWQSGNFGTPTVLVNGKLVNWQQPGWLDIAA
ncbi:DsbA family protein [Amycolatopsis alkalitolerans]|uniref:Thioredoxin-like fold domain-containing protein n=1 Tax=Amycolatopsis alkalitolerans TaxID=2547244 RepID=A0A5C4LSY2_9PSEU|nr:thioredoxin domain-containing protein [Amycolatopsis alkalitolerans]TNC20204.1 hypothetical protein FG385_31285 [Amycolatopsis alkalitolerans]